MDYIIVILVLLFGYSLKTRYAIFGYKEHVLLDQLFFYHMIISFIFYIYISINGGDAMGYWLNPKGLEISKLTTDILSGYVSASGYVYLINYFPSNILDLSFFTGCMLYGVLGYWGIVYLIASLKELFPLNGYLNQIKILNIAIFPTILFLPNFHFWSSGVGKDTLLFFCACGFFYAILNLKKRWFLMAIISLVAYTIRPHILLFLLAGFGVSYVLKSKLFLFQKVLVIGFATALFLPILQTVLEFANIEDASLESINNFNEKKAGHLQNAGSGIDISSLPYPLQVLTFLYRPLFIDAPNFLGILASMENSIWIVLTLNFIRNNPIKVFRKSHLVILSTFLYWLIGALAFAPILGNLGIIIRERNMFLPGFIVFAVAGLYNSQKFKKFEWYYYSIKKERLASQKSQLNSTNEI